MTRRRWLATLSLLALLQLGPTGDEPPAAVIFYLFDVSGSFHTRRDDSPLARAAEQLPAIVKTISAGRLPTPQRHVVGTIGELSYDEPLCDLVIAPKLFFPEDEGKQEQRLRECVEALQRHKPTANTDISGALDFASRVLQAAPEGTRRALVVFSDLVETRGSSSPRPAEPNLTGVCVFVAYAYTSALRRDPSKLDEYLEAWRERFVAARARGHHFELLSPTVAANVAGFLRECRAR